jgi:SAM-dependent methyltransferase
MDVEVSELEQALFSKSYLLKVRMRMIAHAVGPMTGRTGLYIGALPSTLRARLMALGGDWTFTEDRAALPFKDGQFDRVIIVDHLEWVDDDHAFMADIHRVLKTAGMLFVDAEHRKSWTFWRPVRRLFGVEERPALRLREGYTGAGLFDILKDGFDVQETRTYSRFFMEGTETLSRLAVGAFLGATRSDAADREGGGDGETISRRLYTIQSIAYPFFVVADKLDWLLFFTRGYRLMAVARRRLWRPRRAPVLRDGRTLADATLNTRIGTAADF